MKKLFLLLALFGVFATGCESLLPNEQTPNQSTIFITDSEGNYTVDAEGGEIVVSITTNIEYNVVIPEDAQSWLSVADTRAETRLEKLTFIIAPNSGTERRNAMVELVDNESNLQDVISITQRGKTQASANKEILYTTTDGQKLLPYDTDASVFGAILVSNTYKDGKGVLVFDSSVTSIGEFAFVNCRTLASITIPNSVTSIGREAFCGCSGLTSITIPEKVTSIGNYAFYGCSSLKEFKGKFASNDGRCLIINGTLYSFIATGLAEYTIPQNVTTISVGVFKDCNNLKRITIPDSVTRIGMYAFDGCRGELIVNCNIPAGASYLSGAFYGSKFTSVTIGSGVTTIGDYAFYNCDSLTSVTIPNSVTTIGRDAFYGCTGELIVNCNIPSASNSYDGAFYSSKFTSVTIGSGVTTIGDYAFYYCSSLTSVTIPDSVTTIGDYAFYICDSLTSVYCKATTPPVAILSEFGWWSAFSNNVSDLKIYVPMDSVEAYKSAEGWSIYADAIVGYDF
ncbi:MAG: leucine-rich repeat protein [Alistipes sp.]|nr:leucine-rich repeat protein [Alistipes sp.]